MLDRAQDPASHIHLPTPSPVKARAWVGLTHQVWQGDMTWSPGKYSFPFQVHGHSSGRKHASPCLRRLRGQSKRGSGEHPSHFCHLWRTLQPPGYPGVALSVFPRRDCLLTALLSVEVWKYPGNWKNQTQTWPSLEVSAIHQEATFPSQAGCQERPSH